MHAGLRAVPRAVRRVVRHPRGGGGRAHRSERRRQDHGGPRRLGPARRRRRDGSRSRDRTSPASRRRHFATAGIAHAPEGRSVFATLTVEENLALPLPPPVRPRRRAAALDRAYELFPRSASAAARTPARCRAASSGCSRWPACWCSSRSCSSPTSSRSAWRRSSRPRSTRAGAHPRVGHRAAGRRAAHRPRPGPRPTRWSCSSAARSCIAGHPSREEILASVFGQREQTSAFGQSEMHMSQAAERSTRPRCRSRSTAGAATSPSSTARCPLPGRARCSSR